MGLVSKSDYMHDITDLLGARKERLLYKRGSLLRFCACPACFAQGTNVLTIAPPEKVTAKIGAHGAGESVAVEIRNGYHCNSNKPSDEYLIPLKLTWTAAPLEVGRSRRIRSRRWKSTASRRKPLSVYTGNFEI